MTKYIHEKHLLVALDCIIFGFDGEKLNLLLIRRNFNPLKGRWSLLGGFLKSNENLDEAAVRIVHSLTGLTDVFMEQLRIFSDVARDPVERTVSVAYYALIDIESHNKELQKEHNAHWILIKDVPELIFDHGEMVKYAIERLRIKAASHPIGFELLPKKFTIPQLNKLYEAIYEKEIDKRNFNRKVLSTGLLIKLDEKEKESSKKGAFLYVVDRKKYETGEGSFMDFISSPDRKRTNQKRRLPESNVKNRKNQ